MGYLNINSYYGCVTCEFADEYGNGCKQDLMLPVLLVMANQRECSYYKFKLKKKV